MIDTHRTVRRLTDAGMEERKAEVLASVLHDAFGQSERASLRVTTSDFTAALNSFRLHYIVWQVAIAIALVVALKLTHAV